MFRNHFLSYNRINTLIRDDVIVFIFSWGGAAPPRTHPGNYYDIVECLQDVLLSLQESSVDIVRIN